MVVEVCTRPRLSGLRRERRCKRCNAASNLSREYTLYRLPARGTRSRRSRPARSRICSPDLGHQPRLSAYIVCIRYSSRLEQRFPRRACTAANLQRRYSSRRFRVTRRQQDFQFVLRHEQCRSWPVAAHSCPAPSCPGRTAFSVASASVRWHACSYRGTLPLLTISSKFVALTQQLSRPVGVVI